MTWWALAVAAAVAAGLWGAFRIGATASARTARELEQVRHELARRLNELFSLQELSYLLSESLQLDRIVSQVARYVTRFIEVEGSLVALADETDPDKVHVAAAEGVVSALANTTMTRARAGLIGTVIGQDQLEVVEAGADQPAPEIGGITVQRVAAVPLRSHGVTVGTIAVVNRVGGPFTAEDLRLLSTVATHAAVVLANARFFDLIRAGKEQWETTFDALADGIAVIDGAGRIRRANKALANLFGRSLPAVIGLEFGRDLLSDSSELPGLIRGADHGEPPAAITVQALATPGARSRVFRIAAAPMRGAPESGWVVLLIEDVTEQKSLETQLIQNEKMVAVGQLVSGVAHELNNPLTSIAGLSEFLLEQGSVGEKDREHLRVIQEQAERAGRIVRNLLTFARKGTGDYGDVDLNDIAQRTVQLMEYELRLRNVGIETHLAKDLPAVSGDRYELQQVILNLVTNAAHAVTDNETGRERRVVVSTGRSKDHVLLKVSDTGPGIDPAHLPNLFTPFFTTNESGEGTGLGLSISFGIAERHGGKLSVEPGTDGATFVMTLPAGSKTAGDHGSRRSSGRIQRPPPDDPRKNAQPRSILLVDEDPVVQRMIRALFSREGQVVSTPPNAGDAVRLLETSRFELIIADARAAVSAGETFSEALLRLWPEHKSRTIFLTADVRPETHEWLRSTGCFYFQKPFKVSDLRSTVQRVMEQNTGAPT
ncbi:MAG: response regulator [Gemmatimonadetes bacterium]|nr:response regulator [Gemmatimonadota bacterium]